jgi:hypothetical protein
MDRLARQHPAYHTAHLIDETSKTSDSEIEYHFAIEPSANVLKFLHSILLHALECIEKDKNTHELMGYIILASLRLFKVNLYEIVTSEKGLTKLFEEAGFGTDTMCSSL